MANAHNPTTDKAREAVGSAADKTKEAASNFADKAKDAASSFADKAKDTASHLAGQAKDAASTATHRAGEMAQTAGKKADETTASVGRSFESAADTLRSKGPHDGMLGSATSSAASALESTGRYLEEGKLSGMAEDVSELIKRNPIPAILLAAGVGFLLGRTLRS